MTDYIETSLKAGLIRPSSSPAGTVFFFVGKKDGTLRPCIDYSPLNDITVKNRYPLPLMSSVFDQLQQAKIFTSPRVPQGHRLWPGAPVRVPVLEGVLQAHQSDGQPDLGIPPGGERLDRTIDSPLPSHLGSRPTDTDLPKGQCQEDCRPQKTAWPQLSAWAESVAFGQGFIPMSTL